MHVPNFKADARVDALDDSERLVCVAGQSLAAVLCMTLASLLVLRIGISPAATRLRHVNAAQNAALTGSGLCCT